MKNTLPATSIKENNHYFQFEVAALGILKKASESITIMNN